MLSVCVFRRFGLAVPVVFFIVGFLLQRSLDSKYGGGYYTSHFRPFGMNLLITGCLTAVLACIVDPPESNDYVYSAIRDLDLEDMGKNMKDSIEHFVYDETPEDMFCYIPLNRCAMALIVLGLLLTMLGLIYD